MAPKTKPAANGSAKSAAASTNGTTTPVSVAEKKDTSDAVPAAVGGKPDKQVYDAEQDRIKKEIDTLQTKLASNLLYTVSCILMHAIVRCAGEDLADHQVESCKGPSNRPSI